jgi:hypothetical protein
LVTLAFCLLNLKVQAATIFLADFEDGSGGYSADGFTYTADPDATPNLWHGTTHRAVSPTHCQYYGQEGVWNYDTGTRNAGNLLSPGISLVGVTPPITLSFKYLLATEDAPSLFDVATLEISSNGGGSWSTVGTLTNSSSFTTWSIDLSAFFGTTILLRFNFDTLDNFANTFEGWYIDDFTVTGTTTFQTNSWTSSSSSKWELGSNWLGGTPSASDVVDLITNANTKTVTIDPTTTLSNSLNQCLSINNLIISAPAGTANTLQLANPGTSIPLKIFNALTLNSGGAILVTNFALQVSGLTSVGATGSGTLTLQGGTVTISSNLVLGTSAGATGTLWVTGGAFNMTNLPNTTIVGAAGDGQIVISNGTMSTRSLFVGTNQFSRGTITVAGGSLISSNVFFAVASNSTAAVWVNSGEFVATNRVIDLGQFGTAQMTVSNGATLRCTSMFIALRSGSVGTLTVAGGNALINTLNVGTQSNALAAVWVSNGQLVSTNGGIGLGALQSVGQMTISNATVLTRDLTVDNGTLTMQGGTLSFSSAVTSNCMVGASQGSKGSVWINGGTVTATNNGCVLYLGLSGPGQWSLTNGSTTVGNLFCGTLASGTITIAGGTFSVMGNSIVALDGPNLTGTISVASGQLIATNGDFVLGCFGKAPLNVSGGSVVIRSMTISSNYPASGALTIPGGQVTVFDKLVVGDCATNAIGQITVSGGTLYVTNATHTGYLDLRDGTLTINSGTVTIDRLVMTNSCGHFIRTGGTLSITSTNLGAGLDADGDGLPNDWEQMFGFNPLSSVGADEAGGDADGDGQSNLQEFLAGTDPTNSASVFRITGIAPEGDDLRVTWATAGGRTNVLRATSSLSGIYFNISPKIVIPGLGEVVTNYLDKGAVTNTASRFYRVVGGGTWIADSSAPTLTITSPADNSYTTNSSVTVTGTCTDVSGVAGVTVNEIAASSANAYSNWVAVVTSLAIGTNTLTVLAGDNAAPANSATNIVHVIYVANDFDGNGDGVADLWQIRYFGCVGCPNAAPGADPDGDGMSNQQEYLAGTDPTNSASAFRISAIAREGNDLRVTWMTGPDKTNALQLAAGDVDGGYSNNFADIFTVTNTVGFSTNYLDVGSATNSPSRYYRVRLVP